MDFIRLSPTAQNIMNGAAEESGLLGHHYLAVEHVFIALAEKEGSLLAAALVGQKLDVDEFTTGLRRSFSALEHRPWGTEVLVTPRCNEVLQLAARIAAQGQALQVEERHLIEAVLREGRSVTARLLRKSGVSLPDLFEALQPGPTRPEKSPTPTLDRFGRDLTAQARIGALGPVIGREAELELLMQVLLRKNKNNPVLIGDAGVGKTAVVEGLARHLVSASCPAPFARSRVIELSIAALLAGTKFRGEFEERLLTVANEASADPEIILFLDEIHTLVGAGAGSDEAMDAANIFKPALSRGQMRCIGATTIEEYRRFIERDPALERRFEPVRVEEPTPEDTRKILRGLAASFESHHDVRIDEDALDAAVQLAVRYVPNRRLPDKAIDALDQSCARVRLVGHSSGGAAGATVGRDAVACTVSQWTGIPLDRISGEEGRELLQLDERLRARVVGQDTAVAAVSRAIVSAKAGLADPDRPLGVFLFLGPTGVGKTELAKGLARQLFGDEKRLIRFDMSEFSEPHSVAKLIGAPPGYVGSDQEGRLISAVRTHPHCVVLFDELEKAHPQIFDLFLQMFDEGKLSGANGKVADFTQSVIILTSNLTPPPAPIKEARVGFVKDEPRSAGQIDVRSMLSAYLRPELINRFDDVIVFNALKTDDLRRIVGRYVKGIEKLVASRRLQLTLDDNVYDSLIERAESDRFGARELRRVVDRHLRQPLAREILRRGDGVGEIRVTVRDGEIQLV